MPTEVYFLCPKCNGITIGKGNSDILRDEIICKKCSERFEAIMVGNLSFNVDEDDKKWFYIEKSMANILI